MLEINAQGIRVRIFGEFILFLKLILLHPGNGAYEYMIFGE